MDKPRPPASPPCYRHELDAVPFAGAELIAWLNDLLEGERAGARGLTEMAKGQRGAVADQLSLIDRGQGAVDRSLEQRIERIDDAELARDLREMLDVHVRNIERCAALDVAQ